MIKHYDLKGKNIVQSQQWIRKCYPDFAPSKTNESVTAENVKQILNIVMDNRKVKVLRW